MKFIIFFICLVGVFGSFLPNKPLSSSRPSTQNLIDFIIGGLAGVQVIDSIPSGFPCVTALHDLQNATQVALNLSRAGRIQEAAEVFERALIAVNQSCSAASSEGALTFQNFLETIRQPNFVSDALMRMTVNLPTIVQEFRNGVADLNNQSFFNAGREFGNIANTILFGSSDSLVSFITEEVKLLGTVNWPFTNCATSAALKPTAYTLDHAPTKGQTDSLVVKGTANVAVSLSRVQIVTLLNGIPLNTQYDSNTNQYQAGQAFTYSFSVLIPSFAPSVRFF